MIILSNLHKAALLVKSYINDLKWQKAVLMTLLFVIIYERPQRTNKEENEENNRRENRFDFSRTPFRNEKIRKGIAQIFFILFYQK